MSPRPVKLKDWARNIIELRPGPEFKPAGSASLDQVFAVYRNNRDGSRRRALQLSFPLLGKLLSASNFARLCQRYLDNQAVDSNNLNYYGRGLANYLSGELIDSTASLDFFQLLAKFEWRLQELLLQPLNPVLSVAQLQAITAAQQRSLKLRLLPNGVALQSKWPLDEVWLWHQQGNKPAPALPLENTRAGLNVAWLFQADIPEPAQRLSSLLGSTMIRIQLNIAVHHVSGAEFQLFTQLQQRADFCLPDLSQICENLQLDFPATLKKLLQRQWLTCTDSAAATTILAETGYD